MTPPDPVIAWVGAGANLGDAAAAIRAAELALRRQAGVRAVVCSPLYRSAPVDATGPEYVNAVFRVETELSHWALLAVLQAIETDHGRQRPYRHAPRTLDLDLLAHGDVRSVDARLTLPHPRLHERAFVLRPWLDLWPQACVPGVGRLADRLPTVAHQIIVPL